MASDKKLLGYQESTHAILIVTHLYEIFVYSVLEHNNTTSMHIS